MYCRRPDGLIGSRPGLAARAIATYYSASMAGHVEFSTSTWQQPMPHPAAAPRRRVIDHVAQKVLGLGDRRVRVAVDGLTAAGKTSFGHEVAAALSAVGRVALRACLDDFKRPWSQAHLYDRVSGEGYYRNAFDYDAARRLLLEPAGPDGSGQVALCGIDPLTQVDHSRTLHAMPSDGVLIVDGVFAFRPQLDDCWDLRVWLDVDPELSVCRGTARDASMEGGREAAEALHRNRYLAAETIYVREVDPEAAADVVVDNRDFDAPLLRRG